jgi:hypothetical protein
MRNFIEYSLGASHWQWYRRWRGGHWEQCWVDPVMGFMWMQLDHDQAAASSLRRFGTVERLVLCEDW